MASFCKQCAIREFGSGFTSDFAGLSNYMHTKNKLYVIVLCEGCGPCQVDHEGKCVSPDCDEKHGINEEK